MSIAPPPKQFRKPSKSAPARMAPLATLPLFWCLEGKKVVLAGGSEGAAWKAELLAAAGANVHVYTDCSSEDMRLLIERGSENGTFVWHNRPWSADIIRLADMAICDAETDGEAQAFYCAAKAAGVPVNVIDKPKYCQFQFGSIVNRSPVVVGISTNGAAPILGQAIRRKIETLLPPSLKDWAAKARAIRAQVMETFSPGPERRRFWEGFVDRAFSGVAPAKEVDVFEQLIPSLSTTGGDVTLVGAGPGDAEMLTLKAVRALQSADIILFDDLVSDDVLELARREAKRMMVGKRGGRASCKQEDITALMIQLAQQGKKVVRLKSGDPMIFGRAGEEISALEDANIPVSIVPGISAANAMAAALKTSLTHRDHAQSVSFVTGHSRKGELPDTLEIEKLVGEGKTAIVYMGSHTAQALVDRLTKRGVSPDHPAIAVQSVARPEQTKWTGSLQDLPNGCKTLPGDGPILIGIGSVFSKANSETKIEQQTQGSHPLSHEALASNFL